MNRGVHSGLSTAAHPRTLLRGRPPLAPFRASGLLLRSTSRPRWALRLSLGRGDKMPRIRFYNRRFTSRAPAKDTSFGDSPPSAVGNPPAFDLETAPGRGVSALRPRTAPDHLAVIRPPTAPCLTARRRLRPVRLPRLAHEARGGGSSGALSAAGCSAECEPLTPLVDGRSLDAEAPLSRSREPVPSGSTSMTPAFPSSRCLPPQGTNADPLSGARVERCARWPRAQPPHVFIEVRKPRLDPWSPAIHGRPSRPGAPLRLLQDGCLREHSHGPLERPDHRNG